VSESDRGPQMRPEPRAGRLAQVMRQRDATGADPSVVLVGIRRGALTAYAAAVGYFVATRGAPLDREGVLLWVTGGLALSCIGRRPVWLLWLVVDFLPLALVLVFYDYLRGLADSLGMPTWWRPQIEADQLLFAGRIPTVWLQEHLKHTRYSGVRWYDLVACLSYYSFFFLPYLTAGVLWLRSRAQFYRWTLRFVALSFGCFLLFMAVPAAPPWAAGHCTPADVADHPSYAPCMYATGLPPADGLLGRFHTVQPGANPWVERIAGDGLHTLHLGVAHGLWTKGFTTADPVAAVPSLHLGVTVLFCLFLWSRVDVSWRPLLVLYPLVMMFSLAYAGEHYVSDGIAGALAAWAVHWLALRLERRRDRSRSAGEPYPDPRTSGVTG
jgi:hypothetical protein